jgi:prepilin-type N-terminal cleavage/methylation domain-containing protein
MSNKLKQLRAQEGFTIIEVIIVLVIGAVIMLAVFLVVPQLQRSSRNSRQQDNARRILTAVQQYQSNNSGNFPTTNAFTNVTAISGTIKNPYDNKDLIAGDFAFNTTQGASPTKVGQIVATQNYKCDTATTATPGSITASNGSIAIQIGVEPASNSSGTTSNVFCVNN